MPKISLVIPVYNVEKYLEKCLDSVVAQTFQDIEILLIDDGSTDDSLAICKKYAKANPKMKVFSQTNQGLSAARNYGISLAKGEYISFIDSDDYLDADMYETLYQLIVDNQADISVCGVYDCYSDHTIYLNQAPQNYLLKAEEALKLLLIGKTNSVNAIAKLYKRCLFDQVKYPVGRRSEDAFVVVELFKQTNKVAITTAKKYYYVHRTGSITTTEYSEHDKDVIDAYNHNYALIQKYYPTLIPEAEYRCCFAYFYVLDKMLSSSSPVDKNELKEVVKYLRKHYSVVVGGPYFGKKRKLAMRILMFSVGLYKQLVIKNRRVNRHLIG